MDRSLPAVISACFIICLAFTGTLGDGKVWTRPARCRMRVCDKLTYDEAVQENCIQPFNQTMGNTGFRSSCPWPDVRQQYVKLMLCLETEANRNCCTDVLYRHHMLMELHGLYFSLCSSRLLEDPEVPVLLLLIGPCVLFPLLIPFLCQRFRLHEYKITNTD